MSGKLIGKQIDNFIQNNGNGVDFVLIYGNDEAVMQKRLSDITNCFTKSDIDITNIFCKDEKDPVSAIEYAIKSSDFFKPGKLIKIFDITDKIFENIKNCQQNEVRFILYVTEIARSPKIRDFHEGSNGAKNAIAIPCYAMEKQDVIMQINQILQVNQIKTEDGMIIDELAEKIGSNPFDIENEMEKILLLCDKTKILKYDDIKCVMNFDEDSLSELLDYFFSKDIENLQKTYNSSETNSVLLSRSIYKYTSKLITALYNINNGSNKTQEAKNLGIFFKRVPIFQKHLDIWSIDKLENLVIKILEFDMKSRMQGWYQILDLNLLY